MLEVDIYNFFLYQTKIKDDIILGAKKIKDQYLWVSREPFVNEMKMTARNNMESPCAAADHIYRLHQPTTDSGGIYLPT